MRKLTTAMLALILSTIIGFAVGVGLGLLLSPLTYGLSLWLGQGVGTLTGILAGVLSAVDSTSRFAGGGRWIGLAAGLVIALGFVVFVCADDGGIWAMLLAVEPGDKDWAEAVWAVAEKMGGRRPRGDAVA